MTLLPGQCSVALSVDKQCTQDDDTVPVCADGGRPVRTVQRTTTRGQ